MATDPLQPILYRELSVTQAKELLKEITPLLEELVNYGTNALVRCATSTKSDENVDLACLFLYRHILEMTDAVDVLTSNSCAVPSILLLRSSFEALIALDFILEADDLYSQRSLSWIYCYACDQINTYELLDPNTERGRNYQISIDKDKFFDKATMPIIGEERIQNAIENLQRFVSKEQFIEIKKDYSESQKKNKAKTKMVFVV